MDKKARVTVSASLGAVLAFLGFLLYSLESSVSAIEKDLLLRPTMQDVARLQALHTDIPTPEEWNKLASDVETAIRVAGQHGEEFVAIRQDIAVLRAEMLVWVSDTKEMIEKQAGDRFRGADWERERRHLDSRFQSLSKRLDQLQERVERIHP